MTEYTNLEIPPADEFRRITPAPAPARRWPRFLLLGCGGVLLLATLFVGAIFALVFTMMKSSEPYQETVRRSQADKRVVSRLGTPIESGWFTSGNINTSASSGNADLSIPLRGPKGGATAYVVAKKEAGKWKYSTMRVTFEDGTSVDLLALQAVEQEY